MTEASGGASKLGPVFQWGGVVLVLVGIVLIVMGDAATGVLVAVGGVVAWLFSKRRSRRTGG